MESRIEEVREEIEYLAHARPTRRRVVVTVGVLVVTALTTTAAALAALSSSNEGAAIRNRQEAAANAATADLKYEQNVSFANDRIDAGNEAKYRAQILRCFGDPSCQLFYLGQNGPGAQTLNQQATGAEAVNSDITKAAPTSEANVGNYDAKQFMPVDVQQQTAYAYGQAASGWLGREDGFLATIGALAVALFLFGLALTIPHRATGTGFIGLAIVLTLFAAGRIAIVSLGSVPGPSAAAINDFASADYQVSADEGTYQNAQKQLDAAVALRPDFANAWSMLGSVHEDEAASASDTASARRQYAIAVDDYQRAVDEGRQASIDYNDLGFAQMLDGQPAAAAESLHQALALDPSDDVAMATMAENDLMAGHLDTAMSDLDRALNRVAKYGPEFRQLWFDFLRPDQSTLESDGVSSNLVDPFFVKVKDAQASLQDDIGATPGDLHGASVTSFDVTQQSNPISGYVEATAQLTGLQKGDVVRMDFFQNGVEFLSAPSKSWSVGSDSQPTLADQSLDWAPPVPTGDSTAELYVNGNLVKTQTFTMK